MGAGRLCQRTYRAEFHISPGIAVSVSYWTSHSQRARKRTATKTHMGGEDASTKWRAITHGVGSWRAGYVPWTYPDHARPCPSCDIQGADFRMESAGHHHRV